MVRLSYLTKQARALFQARTTGVVHVTVRVRNATQEARITIASRHRPRASRRPGRELVSRLMGVFLAVIAVQCILNDRTTMPCTHHRDDIPTPAEKCRHCLFVRSVRPLPSQAIACREVRHGVPPRFGASYVVQPAVLPRAARGTWWS